ncbi:hypothetical protein F5884DRAFT_345638 [Xylogone sp. PMI_703]|nr:hypothetical protein F5884DRAFT_345638 [Xylogone sp. PMI_703]
MHSAIAAAILAFSSTALGQYTNASDPFTLVLSAANPDYNNHTLVPCHEGAAIEALCVAGLYDPLNSAIFTFNSSDYNLAHPPSRGGPSGILVYSLDGNGFDESSGLGLTYSDVSNVAVPLFHPGSSEAVQVAFDNADILNIQGWIDVGLAGEEQTSVPFYRWYVCKTYVGYAYTTLSWTVGSGYPDNPTCEKVGVKRIFV